MKKKGSKSKVLRVAVMSLSIVSLLGTSDVSALSEPTVEQSGLTHFDTVYSGTYPQSEVTGSALTEDIVNAEYDEDGFAIVNDKQYARIERLNTADGTFGYFSFEPIKWKVLDITGDTVLLQSEKGIDCQQFDVDEGENYNSSTLREWLNTSFYATAWQSGAEDGLLNIGEDKVSILSSADAMSSVYGLNTTSSRAVELTEFTIAQGAQVGHVSGGSGGPYWTSTINADGKVDCINYLGNIDKKAKSANNVSIVPVIKLSLKECYYSIDNPSLEKPVIDKESNSTQWDTVSFGRYPQRQITGNDITAEIRSAQYSNDVATVSGVQYKRLFINGTYQYFMYEPIKWRVLDYTASEIVLQSDKILDVFDGTGASGRYADSKLYQYLNTSLYQNAFNETEKESVIETANGSVTISDDATTTDISFGYGTNTARLMQNSEYASYLGNETGDTQGNPYWIYSSTEENFLNGYVNHNGACIYSIFSGVKGIVPVIHIKRYPYSWYKGVASNSSSETTNPTDSNGEVDGNDGTDSSTNGSGANISSNTSVTTKKSGSEMSKLKPAGMSVKNVSATSQKVSWNKLSGVSGYVVYRATSKTGTYSAVATTESTSAVVKKLKKGKKYFYVTKGYKVLSGNVQYTDNSSIVYKTAGNPRKPKVTVRKTKSKKVTTVFLKWSNVSDAKYVQIYRKSNSGAYKEILDTTLTKKYKKGARISYTSSSGKYSFKIRTYNKINKKKYYSAYSGEKKVAL